MKTLLVILASLLAGCAGMLTPLPSADQIKSAVPGPNKASVVCANITGIGGSGHLLVITMDDKVIDNGGVNVSTDCTSVLTNAATVRPVIAPVPKPVTP